MAAAEGRGVVPLKGDAAEVACCLHVDDDDSVAVECCRVVIREMGDHLLAVGCDVDSFQGFNEELRLLPGKYSESVKGSLLLCVSGRCSEWEARADLSIDDCIGVIAIKDVPSMKDTAEIKRLFVRPGAARGKGLGKSLTLAILEEAQRLGYAHVVLDTLVRLPHAVRLYESLKFRPREPYVHNPMEDALFFEAEVDRVLADNA
jgi:putative acetyltransferase